MQPSSPEAINPGTSLHERLAGAAGRDDAGALTLGAPDD